MYLTLQFGDLDLPQLCILVDQYTIYLFNLFQNESHFSIIELIKS